MPRRSEIEVRTWLSMNTRAQKNVCEEAGLSTTSATSADPPQSLMSIVQQIAANKQVTPAPTGPVMTATEAADVTALINLRAKSATKRQQTTSAGSLLLSADQGQVLANNVRKLNELLDYCEFYAMAAPGAAVAGTLRNTEDGEELKDLADAFQAAVRKVQLAQALSGSQDLKKIVIHGWDPVVEEEEEGQS